MEPHRPKASAGTVLRASLALGCIDGAVTAVRGGGVPVIDRALSAVTATGLTAFSVALTGAVWALAALILRRLDARIRKLVALPFAGALGALIGLAVFSGTGVRRHGLSTPLVVASVVVAVALAALAERYRTLGSLRRRWDVSPLRFGATGALAALAVYGLHALVLVRQYALLHGLLAVFVSVLFLVASGSRAAERPRALAAVFACVVVASLGLSRGSGLRSTLRRVSPLAQYPARAVSAALGAGFDAPAALDDRRANGGPSLPLRGRDIVLVTIDALRADGLRALGGRGRTPTLDGMASRGVLFTRAWCATPHTSYSLASLMTGTHARALMSFPGTVDRLPTLAGLLGAHGWTTAGFFPPAVFAVDGDRFEALARRRFDFGSTTVDYASAADRSRQVDAWLASIPASRRVFVWVHLFEPHEPYEPSAAFPYGDGARERYEAECSVADAGVASLRAVLRRRQRDPVWIVTADHGEEFGEHGGTFHGTTVYEEQLHVPLIVEGQGIDPRAVDVPVSLVDIAPTLVAGAGVAVAQGMEGRDLGPVTRSGASVESVIGATGSLRAVTFGRRKLVVDLSDNSVELFDLVDDPSERRNIADDAASDVRGLRARLAGWDMRHARAAASLRSTAVAPEPMPQSLARALQGDRSSARDLIGLLHPPGGRWALDAARSLGDLGVRDAVVLGALGSALADSERAVADESAISLGLLGDGRGVAMLRPMLTHPTLPRRRRAALALARCGDRDSAPTLAALATDAHAADADRDAAITALRQLRSPAAFDAWTALLEDLRLAPVAAESLGELGDPRAIPRLVAALATQRYPLSLRAILAALVVLRDPSARVRTLEVLGRTDPLPEVFALLAAQGEPGRSIPGSTRPRSFLARVQFTIPARQGARRVYLRIASREGGTVSCGRSASPVGGGTREIAVDVAPRSSHCRADFAGRLLGVASVPRGATR